MRETPEETITRLYVEIAQHAAGRRFRLLADMNDDGRVTISDIWLWLKWFIYAPGDGVLLGVMVGAPQLGQFLELNESYLYGWLSLTISIVLWIIGFAYMSATISNATHLNRIRKAESRMMASYRYDSSPQSEMWRTRTYEEESARQDRAEREGRVRMPVK